MILPVYVSYTGKEELVYALLDTQSDSTFISAETCTALGATGTDVSTTTINANNA